MSEEESRIILYTTDDGKSQVSLMSRDGRIWLNQKQMAELFAVTKMNISLHIANILKEKELDESVVKSYFTTAADGKRYNVVYYALEMILAVGFRVRGVRGTQFRQWANAHLSEYLVKGFTTFGARRRRGLRTRRTWRNCDESRTKPSAMARSRRAEMNAEELEKIVARHEMQCLELKESFNVERIETACAFFL